MMNDWAKMVAEFNEKNGYPPPQVPKIPTPKIQVLRLRLMAEELGEAAAAIHEQNMEKIADGLCDLLYVTVGTAVEYGLGPILNELFREVQRSNMTKFGDVECHFQTGVKYQPKVGKGPQYSPPDIAGIIEAYEHGLNP